MSTRPPPRPPSPELVHLLDELRAARFALGLCCPRCGCGRVHRWGSFSGRQRYLCLGCKRTFSDLTRTPAAYSKKLLLWRDYGQCLAEGLSVRRAARRAGIHPATAFRWRHAMIGSLLDREPDERLAGWIELCTIALPYSEKGRRRRRTARDEERRRRAAAVTPEAWTARLLARVLVACDRRGRTATGTAGIGATARIPSHEIERILHGRVEGPAQIVAADGPLSPAATAARRAGWRFHDARPRAGLRPRSLVHIHAARAYVARLLDWLDRFRGVATRYLPNYLAWHGTLDRQWRRRVQAEVLRWPMEWTPAE